MLRALFSSAEFGASIGAKVGRPFEHLISVSRLMQIQPVAGNLDAPYQLVDLADNAGHNPFGQPFPTGQADVAVVVAAEGDVDADDRRDIHADQ